MPQRKKAIRPRKEYGSDQYDKVARSPRTPIEGTVKGVRPRGRSRTRADHSRDVDDDDKMKRSLMDVLSPKRIGRALSRSRSRSRSRSMTRRGFLALAPHCDGNLNKAIEERGRSKSRSRARPQESVAESNRPTNPGPSRFSCFACSCFG